MDKILNVISALLSVLTEIWVLRVFGVNHWDDIIGGVVIMFFVPVIVVPWYVFREWLGYIFGVALCGVNAKGSNKGSRASVGDESQRDEERLRRESRRGAWCEETAEAGRNVGEAQRAFLYFMSSLSAKIAKADGHVDDSEIAAIEQAFEKLRLSETQRRFCVEIFRTSVASEITVSALAAQMKKAPLSAELISLIYEILWNVACADGVLTQGEKNALRLVSSILGLNSYDRYYRQRVKADSNSRFQEHGRPSGSVQMTLDDAYEILGCTSSSTDLEVKLAYREKAKKNHPDVLRACGLPDEMIGVATRRMSEINAAWTLIRESRHI